MNNRIKHNTIREHTNDNELLVYKTLKKLNIDYSYVEYSKEEKDNADLIDSLIEVKAIKNLLFKTRNLKKDLFLVILHRDKRFDTKAFRNKFNITKIELVNNEELLEFLNTKEGEVSIIDLLFDKEGKIKLFIDKDVLEEEYFRFHPCNGLVTVRIKTSDLINKLIPYLNHELVVLEDLWKR